MIKIGSKLTQEELEQASGGKIVIEEVTSTVMSTNEKKTRTTYSVYDSKGRFVMTCMSLKEAEKACDAYCCPKDIVDLRPGASEE